MFCGRLYHFRHAFMAINVVAFEPYNRDLVKMLHLNKPHTQLVRGHLRPEQM